jgi:DUF971 family protein
MGCILAFGMRGVKKSRSCYASEVDIAPNPARGKRVTPKHLKEVGRYAVGIEWADGHESILPYRDLRAACPCDVCGAGAAARVPELSPAGQQVVEMRRLGEGTLFFRWGDGHETLLVGEELRELCRCAYCAGEPTYPITKQ